jgi:hypothetical protein
MILLLIITLLSLSLHRQQPSFVAKSLGGGYFVAETTKKPAANGNPGRNNVGIPREPKPI